MDSLPRTGLKNDDFTKICLLLNALGKDGRGILEGFGVDIDEIAPRETMLELDLFDHIEQDSNKIMYGFQF